MSKVRLDGAAHASAVDPTAYAVAHVRYVGARGDLVDEVEAAVARRLAPRPKRLAHTRSVAATAEAMAVRYGVDPWEARLAGLMHDWDKVLGAEEQLEKARALGVDLGVDLELVVPLLHGITAAAELARAYPAVPPSVFQAVRRHTIGAVDMSDLDMVVFAADIIEPRRPAAPSVEAARTLVAAGEPLEKVYWSTFSRGISYVVETGRYLYPGTIDIYNELALRRMRRRERKE